MTEKVLVKKSDLFEAKKHLDDMEFCDAHEIIDKIVKKIKRDDKKQEKK